MWIVAKVKFREINIFKKDLTEKVGSKVNFYSPTVECQQIKKNKIRKYEKQILENYVFCYHEKFSLRSFITQLKFAKGLVCFLNGYNFNQKEITNFIDYCRSFENKDGYLTPAFFNTTLTQKAKFISGPFTNMIFQILERKKNKIKILLGNIVTTVSNNTKYLYRPA